MTINNKTYFLRWRILLSILILVVIADFSLSQLSGSIGDYFEDHIPAMVSGILILIMASIRVNYFSYEDEYEIVHIRSKSLIFGSFETPAQTRYEFPKRIIYDFDYDQNFFRKRLTIFVATQQGIKKIRKFNLTFMPSRKLKSLISSLEKIRERNKQDFKAQGLV